MRFDRNALMQRAKDSGLFRACKNGNVYTRRPFKARRATDDAWKSFPFRLITTQIGGHGTKTYTGFRFRNTSIYSHVFIYFWFHGPIPVGMEVDHKNQNREDGRLRNLELVTREVNEQRKWTNPNNKKVRERISDKLMGHVVTAATRAKLRAAWVRRKTK